MTKKTILIIAGDDSQFDDAGRVKEGLEKHAKGFKVEELQELGEHISTTQLKNKISNIKAVVLLCMKEFSEKINSEEEISLAGGGAPVRVEGPAIPKCLSDSTLKKKFVVISFETPVALPHKLDDLGPNNIFEYNKNISDPELYRKMKTVATHIASK